MDAVEEPLDLKTVYFVSVAMVTIQFSCLTFVASFSICGGRRKGRLVGPGALYQVTKRMLVSMVSLL